jgi:hypothetical protein
MPVTTSRTRRIHPGLTAALLTLAPLALTSCSHTAAHTQWPGICRDIQAIGLDQADAVVDAAESSNGQTGAAGEPMTAKVMATLGRDARDLQTYAAQANGPMRTALQNEALMFTAASNSPNGTVSNNTAASTDTAYKGITAQCS